MGRCLCHYGSPLEDKERLGVSHFKSANFPFMSDSLYICNTLLLIGTWHPPLSADIRVPSPLLPTPPNTLDLSELGLYKNFLFQLGNVVFGRTGVGTNPAKKLKLPCAKMGKPCKDHHGFPIVPPNLCVK